MKRILLATCLLFVSMSLIAVSWSAGAGVAVHESSVYGDRFEGAVTGSVDDISFGVMLSDYSGAFDVKWDYRSIGSYGGTLGTSLNGYYKDGGLWTLYADIGKDKRYFKRFVMNLHAGAQVGVSWSDNAEFSVPFSVSPYVRWEIGYDDDTWKAILYGDSMRMFEHTFQAPPVLGLELGWNIDGHNSIGLDSYMKLADYMDGPDLMITDWALRLAYVYRGDTECEEEE